LTWYSIRKQADAEEKQKIVASGQTGDNRTGKPAMPLRKSESRFIPHGSSTRGATAEQQPHRSRETSPRAGRQGKPVEAVEEPTPSALGPSIQLTIKMPDLERPKHGQASSPPKTRRTDAVRELPSDTKLIGETIPGYGQYSIHGFMVYVHKDVFEHEDDEAFSVKPLEVLEADLGTIATVLPPRYVKLLRQISVWAEWDDITDPDYHKDVLAKYYGVFGDQVLWGLRRGKHPLKANNVEILTMRKFMEEYQKTGVPQRCVLLHEMSHAVHTHALGYDNATIRSAYAQAMERRLYSESKDWLGRKIIPYAQTNAREYFAELSCAYLSRLNYYPHDRQDLMQYDPVGYRLMELSWGTPKQLEAAFKADSERLAAAALKKARRLIGNNKEKQAEKILVHLLEKHPDTKVASDAKGLLEILKKSAPNAK
jgi:hypothetical protein